MSLPFLFISSFVLHIHLRYLEAGYEYVNIDDCWSELERDENGKIVADKKRFPRGLKFLSDYVRERIVNYACELE